MKNCIWVGILVVLFSGCWSIQPIDGPPISKLTPYVPLENIVTPFTKSTPELENEPPLVPTAAPVVHVVALGETISSIAQHYGVTIDAVRAANPDANPNILIVGDELIIPFNELFTATGFNPEVGGNVKISNSNCVPSKDAGMWCAVLVENLGENDLENIVVAFSFLDPDGNLIDIKYAPSMMRYSPVGSSTPAAIFLKTYSDNFAKATSALFSAQIVDTATKLYLPIVVEEETWLLEGMEATISGNMRVESDQKVDRADIWIGAAAFDEDGVLVGVRRLDSVVATNESFGFNLTVYSTASNIARIELFSEAY